MLKNKVENNSGNNVQLLEDISTYKDKIAEMYDEIETLKSQSHTNQHNFLKI